MRFKVGWSPPSPSSPSAKLIGPAVIRAFGQLGGGKSFIAVLPDGHLVQAQAAKFQLTNFERRMISHFRVSAVDAIGVVARHDARAWREDEGNGGGSSAR